VEETGERFHQNKADNPNNEPGRDNYVDNYKTQNVSRPLASTSHQPKQNTMMMTSNLSGDNDDVTNDDFLGVEEVVDGLNSRPTSIIEDDASLEFGMFSEGEEGGVEEKQQQSSSKVSWKNKISSRPLQILKTQKFQNDKI